MKLQNYANKSIRKGLNKMAPPTRKDLKRGAYGYGDNPEDAAFLRPDNPVADRGNWDASASGVGYNAKFDDDYGYRTGQGAYTDENEDGLKLRNLMPDESRDDAHEALAGLIDNEQDLGSGNKLTGGGGPVNRNRFGGVGSGKPRFAPKQTKPYRTNSRDR